MRYLAIFGLLPLLFVNPAVASQDVLAFDTCLALIEKIERHQLTSQKPLEKIISYILNLVYDHRHWNWPFTGSSESLPGGILTSNETSTLRNMVEWVYRGKQRGVIHTSYGDIAMYRVLKGIHAGINGRKLNISNPFTSKPVSDLYFGTLGGILGSSVISKTTTPYTSLFGQTGYWQPNTQCPKTFYYSTSAIASDSLIRGGIDGFLLGSMLPKWKSRGVLLSQLLRMYYQDGDVFDRDFAACRRMDTFNETIDDQELTDQTTLATYLSWNISSSVHQLNVSALPSLAHSTVKEFLNYLPAGSLGTQYRCPATGQSEGCSLSANIIFVLDESGSIGNLNYQVEKNFVKKIIQEFDISPYNVRVGIVEYSTSASESIKLGEYSSKSALLCAIDSLSYLGGGTSTGLALLTTYSILRNAQSKAGPSQANDPQIVILLTDGYSNRGVSYLTTIVTTMKNGLKDLTMVAVGVGSNVNQAELRVIATDPGKHIFSTSDFSQLVSLAQQLNNQTCKTATVLKPEIQSINSSYFNETKVTIHVKPGNARYFKIDSNTLYTVENITVTISPLYGSVIVFGSRTHETPDEEIHDFKRIISEFRRSNVSSDNGESLEFINVCEGYSASNCRPLYLAVVGRNSSIGCFDRDCSVPYEIKVEVRSGSCSCYNGGTCSFTESDGYKCRCPARFTGKQCESIVGDNCVDNKPCNNGGTCLYIWFGKCYCSRGFTGRNCETNLMVEVTCTNNYMEIELKRQFFSDIYWRNLHLISPTCRAINSSTGFKIRTALTACGTNYSEGTNTIRFENQVMNDYRYGSSSAITRRSAIIQSFHCEYSRRDLVSTKFDPSNDIVRVSEGRFGNFTFKMHICKKRDCQEIFLPNEMPVSLKLGNDLHVQFQVYTDVRELVVFADNCRATPSTDPNATPKYEFLKNGCKKDPTMKYNYNPSSAVQQFSIQSFRFALANSKIVYIHCELLVCLTNSQSSRCSSGCISSARRRRRAAGGFEDTSSSYALSTGPIVGETVNKADTDQSQGSETQIQAMTAGLGAMGGVLIVVVVVAILLFVLKARKPPTRDEPASFANKGFDGPAEFTLKNVENARDIDL